MTRLVRPLPELKRRATSLKQHKLLNFRIGDRGEKQANSWLLSRGFWLVDQNLSFDNQEIDSLALHPQTHTLLLAEIKTRSQTDIAPTAAVSWQKRRVLWQAGQWFMHHWQMYLAWRSNHNHSPKLPSTCVAQPQLSQVFPKSARFAIISVVGKQLSCTLAAPW